MKFVERPDRDVETQGLGETAQMTIKADARAFRNLVDSIYAEKEKTVVRELIANAFDAHAAAGTPEREIVVHLPSVFEPTFSVRDFGVGMSHDFIMRHYTCLFDSTKQGDNGQTGMFGVGSKSPLAITDSFIVKCYDPATTHADGSPLPARIRRYSVHIPAAGVPTISRTFDAVPEDETDCRGVEIIVPIERESREKLLAGLGEQQFFWFDKPIRFEGAYDEVKAQTYATIINLAEGLYYAPKPKNQYGSTWKLFARQGAAVYPLMESQISEYIDRNVRDAIRSLCEKGHHVLLDLPLGTAEVTLAREAIQYGEQTRKNIATCINNAFEQLTTRFAASVGTTRHMRVALEAIVTTLHGDYKTADWATIKLCSSLLPLVTKLVHTNYRAWVDAMTPEQKDAMAEWDRMAPTPSRSLSNSNFPEGKVLLHSGKVKYKSFEVGSPSSTMTFKHPHVTYIIPSHLQKWQDRIKKHVEECKDYTEAKCNAAVDCYVIRCAKRSVDDVVKLLKSADVYTQHYTLDDLPHIEDGEQRQRTSSKTSVYPWTGSSFDDKKVEPDYLLPAYYVARIGNSTEVSFESHSEVKGGRIRRVATYTFVEIIKSARKLGILDANVPIYRVTENQADRIERQAPHWQHLPDLVFGEAERLLKAEAGILDIRQSSLYSSFDHRFEEKLCSAYGSSSGNSASNARLRAVLEELAAADPIFRTMVGFRLAKRDKKDGLLLTGDEELSTLLSHLNMKAEIKESAQLALINELTTEFGSRYEYLAQFFSNSYYSGLSEGLLTHVEVYASGLLSEIVPKKHAIDPTVFVTLKPFADYFDEQVAKHKPVSAEEEINDEAA